MSTGLRVMLVALLAFAFLAHHATAAPLTAPAHAAHGGAVIPDAPADCPGCAHGHGDALAGLAALCLAVAAAVLTVPRRLAVAALRLTRPGRPRASGRTLAVRVAAMRAPPRPPDLTRLCVQLR